MIRSFACPVTERLWQTGKARELPALIHRRALDKLQILHAVGSVDVLRVPPGNRLEMLKGNRKGLWSVRINDQWRLVFRFEGQNAYDVIIEDYH
jgi:proteic killer suppression protein